ncbi:Os05g0520200, partial [Oryza sativa Japonica Group]
IARHTPCPVLSSPFPPPRRTDGFPGHGCSAAAANPEPRARQQEEGESTAARRTYCSRSLTPLVSLLSQGEDPWLAASLRPGNFLPGLAIGFLLGLLVDLTSSWRPQSSPPLAPAAPAPRGSKRTGGSSSAGGGIGGEELKMVLVVRKDLKMRAGKIASQCAHAATGLYAELMARC